MNNSDKNPAAQPPKPGRGMLVIGWLIILGMLTLVFGNWERRQENPNQVPISRIDSYGQPEVVLQRNRYGHYVTSGFINGKQVTLLLDTGATSVAVSEKAATQLGLEKMARGRANTANGVADMFFTRIATLSIGDIQLEDVSATINPGMNYDDTVLLGMSALKEIEFIQRGNQLTLRQIQ